MQLWRQDAIAYDPLLNTYGPTETTIAATTYDVVYEQESSRGLEHPDWAAISQPKVYILDSGKPVPTGVAGELYIGGAGVARGS